LGILQSLIEKEGRDELRYELGILNRNYAYALMDESRIEESLAAYDRTMAMITDQVVRETHGDLTPQVAITLSARSLADAENKDIAAAVANCEKAESLMEGSLSEEEAELYREELAEVYFRSAQVYLEAGRFDPALDRIEKARRVRQELSQLAGYREMSGELALIQLLRIEILLGAGNLTREEAEQTLNRTIPLIRSELERTDKAIYSRALVDIRPRLEEFLR
jgi:tetratricopeptide (TPR) repeat protein